MSLFTKRKATDFIVVHTTATPEGREYTAKDIDKMHRQRGFVAIGYHYIVRLDGTVEPGRPEDVIGAHVEGHNSNSVALSYVGGVTNDGKLTAKDTRTPAQKAAMLKLIQELKDRYPNAKVQGHRDFVGVAKACPCFNAIPEYAHINARQSGYAPAVRFPRDYVVVKGDTLYSIARARSTTVDAIAKASGINPNAPLNVGQKLTIP